MNTCVVIVAGGRSSRMGRQKGFETIRGQSILNRIVSTLAPQCGSLVVNSNDDDDRWRQFDLPVVPDLRRDIGTPLAGVHVALSHAIENGFGAVMTVPSDSPFLPSDLLMRLSAAKRSAAIAASGGQAHYITGLWSCELLPELQRVLDQPRTPRLQDWARLCDAAVIEWPCLPYDPFFNVNTPEDLAEAERIAAEFNL